MKIGVSSHINQLNLHFFVSSSENLDKFPMYIPYFYRCQILNVIFNELYAMNVARNIRFVRAEEKKEKERIVEKISPRISPFFRPIIDVRRKRERLAAREGRHAS